jgi:heme exporter protein A
MSLVELDKVSKRYGSHWALVRLSLAIPAQSAVLLTGPNGAGKTTLLRLLATALKPTRGTLRLFGAPADEHLESVRARLGLVTHKSHLYDDLSAQENLQLVARLAPRVAANRIPALLERVGLGARAHSAVRTFSAGMQRRLCLARVLLREPELVLLDEPFSQLDPEGVALVAEIIGELKRRGVTLVLSTHDIDRGLALCDLHLHLERGHALRRLEPIAALAGQEVRA